MNFDNSNPCAALAVDYMACHSGGRNRWKSPRVLRKSKKKVNNTFM